MLKIALNYACIKDNKNIDLFHKIIYLLKSRVIFNAYLIIYLNCIENLNIF